MLLLLVPLLCAPGVAARRRAAPPPPPTVDQAAAQLIGRALTSDIIWDRLEVLTDDIGHRLSGSAELDRAAAWGVAAMQADGLVNIRAEPVMVPRWVRGSERVTLVSGGEHELQMLGLGMSVGTPADGVEADVVVVSDWDGLAALGRAGVEGRIVLYDVPFTGYGATVQYRLKGAIEAAKLGAVGVLIRSVTPESLGTPHTGAMQYEDGVPKIPAAALSIEHAALLHRLYVRGEAVRVRIEMQAEHHEDVPGANIVGEVRGRELPEEIVVVGCHLDSWDVGQGAQDDGAGCVMALEAGRLIASLPTPPRRTVRVVLYTNEENGLMGGKTYAQTHAAERHIAVLEADIGAGEPQLFGLDAPSPGNDAAMLAVVDVLGPITAHLAVLGMGPPEPGYSGSDVRPVIQSSPTWGFGLRMDTTGYWPIHHTHADTLDKIDPSALRRDAAALALMTWAAAELDLPTLVLPPED